MNIFLISVCLFCAVFANPIINLDLDSPALDKNTTETLLVAQSSGNDTSSSASESSESVESPSSENSSESESVESVESASSESTPEESDSVESNENTQMLVETSDDSMASEENVRKSWVRVFATVVRDGSAEDNSREMKDQQPEKLSKLSEKQPMMAPTTKTLKQSGVSLLQNAQAVSETSSESSESNNHTPLIMTATADSSQSASSESNETSSSSSSSEAEPDSVQSSESHEDSDSAEMNQIKNCVNGTQSCESEEYVFQDIGDDANYSVDNLMVLDEDDRELSLRR
ncbi:secretory calcium-binding phosphoprotein 1 isoform X2 [Boleophthalmus pectinirostris]|uniref:secretory calcium-binding phosphoprotein 1 isoform X2 n=1 Tax=Boleophthalmus pectinirostris TaxID=150288 RepID=UPI00242A5D64|nr:secretory calcium-binding phosphoprotein 1 isoform X2 [Boleophthalmus pectinirostris]